MCASRMQRILTALMLGIILYFFSMGIADIKDGIESSWHLQVAIVLQVFVIIMMLIWAFTNFCPSTWLMKKVFPPCPWDNE